MRWFVSILLFAIVLLVLICIRHRHVIAAAHAPLPEDEQSRDVAAVLRSLGPDAAPADKPWARQFAQFVNEHPGRQWVVGRCAQPCLSEVEAAQQARGDAAARVFPLLLRQTAIGRLDSAWLRDRAQRDITEGQLEVDRCAESFTRPYGQVWAESVLLDVSPDRLDELVGQYTPELHARHARVARGIFAAALLSGLTWLAYLLLNFITKGYFTGRLRLAAAVLTLAVVALLV